MEPLEVAAQKTKRFILDAGTTIAIICTHPDSSTVGV
jgi:hypothetical protein